MKQLIDKIQSEGLYLGKGIIKVDGFINHQIEPALTMGFGPAFVESLKTKGVATERLTKIVTAEVSGISPALATAYALNIPMVFARKHKPVTMIKDCYSASAPSRTKQVMVDFSISREYLTDQDVVVIIDDFLAKGLSIEALVKIVHQAGATLLGIGAVVEKTFESGRDYLEGFVNVPIVSLAKIALDGETINVF